jgi:hypothetical protein
MTATAMTDEELAKSLQQQEYVRRPISEPVQPAYAVSSGYSRMQDPEPATVPVYGTYAVAGPVMIGAHEQVCLQRADLAVLSSAVVVMPVLRQTATARHLQLGTRN